MIPLPYESADIAENRQGRLSSAQRTLLEQGFERGRRYGWVRLTVLFTILVLFGIIQRPTANGIIGGAIFEVAFVSLMVWLVRFAGRRALARLRDDSVECVTGRLQQCQRSRYGRTYYVVFGGSKTLVAPPELIKPHRKELEEHAHRVYYLNRGERVVSFEPM